MRDKFENTLIPKQEKNKNLSEEFFSILFFTAIFGTPPILQILDLTTIDHDNSRNKRKRNKNHRYPKNRNN